VQLAKSIVLVGFMGAGKSSIGRCIQRLAGLTRIDTDELATMKLGMPISEIFLKHGESRFREVETEVLRELELRRPSIVVTGGGTVLRNKNVDLLRQLGTVVWLDADDEILFERATRKSGRPLLEVENPRASFKALLAARRPLYEEVAEIRIDTTKLTHDEVAEAILKRIEELALQK